MDYRTHPVPRLTWALWQHDCQVRLNVTRTYKFSGDTFQQHGAMFIFYDGFRVRKPNGIQTHNNKN